MKKKLVTSDLKDRKCQNMIQDRMRLLCSQSVGAQTSLLRAIASMEVTGKLWYRRSFRSNMIGTQS